MMFNFQNKKTWHYVIDREDAKKNCHSIAVHFYMFKNKLHRSCKWFCDCYYIDKILGRPWGTYLNQSRIPASQAAVLT